MAKKLRRTEGDTEAKILEKILKRNIRLVAGSAPRKKVWIGAPVSCYDEVKTGGGKLHLLVFTIPQAKAAVEMLQAEIDRYEEAKSDTRTNRSTH